MRHLIALIFLMTSLGPAHAAAVAQAQANANSPEAGLRWIKEYRDKPDPDAVPMLIQTLSQRGLLTEPETSGVYLGFLAGVLGSNPKQAKELAAKTLPLPFEDQWFLIKAIAYSGLPQWQKVLLHVSNQMPSRQLMVGYYLTGKLPTLEQIRLEPEQPSAMDKMKAVFKKETYFGKKGEKMPDLTFASRPELIDVQWGIYFATGKDKPIERVVSLLPWSKDRDSVEKLTIGGMAKFTLATNATRDEKLLRALRRISTRQDQKVLPLVMEVIVAAETSDTGRIRKEALAAVEELRRKGPGSKRDIATWGQIGQTTLALGCMGAALAGQAEFGLPCVIGGGLSSAALRYLAAPE
jgi:hypothetical protein